MHIPRSLRLASLVVTVVMLALTSLGSTTAVGGTPAPTKSSQPAPFHMLRLPDGSPAILKVRRAGTDNGLAAMRLRPMAAGGSHGCAILAGDQVICWGENDWGQVGVSGFASVPFPVFVHGLAAPPVNLAVGEEHSCALLNDGRIQCWGGDAEGQLGNGSFSWSQHPAPVLVTGLQAKAIDLAAGSYHTCALLQNGHVQCWGSNYTGQLGDGTTTDRSSPVTVNLPGAATWITAGCNHSCALLADGRMYCWGWNSRGQLGVSGIDQSTTPAQVTAVSGRGETIEAGCDHTCAAYQDAQGTSRLSCWGWNGLLQMPSQQGTGVTILLMRAGMGHTCLLTAQHSLLCWGYNRYGQLGDGTTRSRHQLAAVTGMAGHVFYMTTAGEANHTCAVLDDGQAFCWGSNMWGQLGNGSQVLSAVPQQVFGLGNVRDFSAGSGYTCAVLTNGSLWCWGQRFNTSFIDDLSMPTRLASPSQDTVAVAAGESHSCVLMANGTLRCWGDNGYGQLGDGTTNLTTTPVVVHNLGGKAKAVRVGQAFSCALLASGAVRCWGHNSRGQLGIGSKQDSHLPVTVHPLGSAKNIGAGANHACAVLTNGNVYCWGANDFGQIGDGTTHDRVTPVRVNLPGAAESVAAGDYHTCARLQNGQVWCWGANGQGQLGNPNAGWGSERPVQVQNLGGAATALDAGGYTTCAVVGSGLRCWGENMYGQDGDGSYRAHSRPVSVAGLAGGVQDVRVSFDHACAQMDAGHGGRLMCWGSDAYGQLGRHRDLRWPWPIPLGETPHPLLQPNHGAGRAGSVFTLVGANLPTTTGGRISINGHTVFTSLVVDESDQVRFFVDTQGAAPGDYFVTVVAGGKQAAAVLRVMSGGTRYAREGDGLVVHIPAHAARHVHRSYMPGLVR